MLPIWVDGIAVLVVTVVFANAIWNTAVGSTGGVAFATLAAALGPAVAIPVQSIVEGTSASYRIWHLREQIDFGFVGAFAIGGVLGGGLGFPVLRWALSPDNEDLFDVLVAVIMLAMTWLPAGRTLLARRGGPAITGTLTTFFSLFVGGMGVLIAAVVEGRGASHPVVIATYTTAVYLQYLLRLLLFGITGAIIRDHLGLVSVMVFASLLGTWIGAKLLLKVDPKVASRLPRALVTVIVGFMLVRALL